MFYSPIVTPAKMTLPDTIDLKGIYGSLHKGAPLIRMSSYRARGLSPHFHIDSTSTANIEKIMRENIRKESRLMTDEGRHYKPIGRDQT
jgi:hypothetical protein